MVGALEHLRVIDFGQISCWTAGGDGPMPLSSAASAASSSICGSLRTAHDSWLRAGVAAYEGVVDSAAGIYWSSTWDASPDPAPLFNPLPLASTVGALRALEAIVATLIVRERTGFGQGIFWRLIERADVFLTNFSLSPRTQVADEPSEAPVWNRRGRDFCANTH